MRPPEWPATLLADPRSVRAVREELLSRGLLGPGAVGHELLDPDVFTAFSVVVPSPTDLPLQAGDVPPALGTPTDDGQHVLVLREAVLTLADAPSRDTAWHDGFAAMLDHAQKAGWVSADGTAIQAHCTAPTGTSP